MKNGIRIGGILMVFLILGYISKSTEVDQIQSFTVSNAPVEESVTSEVTDLSNNLIPESFESSEDESQTDTVVIVRDIVNKKDFFLDSLSRQRRLWGIDISKYQTRVNWNLLVKKNKPDFVFVKATEGVTIRDKMYRHHKKNLEKHSIIHGAYHFWSFRTGGAAQARQFIRFARLKKGNLAPVVDVEYNGRRIGSKRRLIRELKQFCKVIENHYGVKPIIYTQPNLYKKYLRRDFSKYPMWFASYSKAPRHEWAIWQHTSRGRIYGFRGRVDKNIMKTNKTTLESLFIL